MAKVPRGGKWGSVEVRLLVPGEVMSVLVGVGKLGSAWTIRPTTKQEKSYRHSERLYTNPYTNRPKLRSGKDLLIEQF